ncbi:Norsolorinic acid ketoreductase [Lachnellula suecica]|uniref:Norsolorinic acid ketoreductase n=1 Tax=Lachnellula suecica TaxID=602035 RepID=A0A8T9CND8_9HELO|nr:Norsolorinic acid ketoreductase [Lachnellula suecica]
MSSNTIYLVTGANRGIGKGLAAAYLSRPNNTVVAAVRDASHSTSKALESLTLGASSKLIIVSIDNNNEDAPAAAIKLLQSAHGISHLDVLIANAAINDDYSTTATIKLDVLKSHVAVNAYAPILLFQAALPLLEKAKVPKFVAIGTPMASIGGIESRPFSTAAYSMSKVMLHFAMRKIHFEHADIVSFPIDPGFVQTDMGNSGAQRFGMKEATTTIADSVGFITSTIDEATKEKHSGHFPTLEGGDFAW